ncbi:hypothetical protein KR044_012977, partial [Drosophila immigrans]
LAKQLKMAESHSFNDFVTCPYDKSHRLLRGRLPKHLISCGRNLVNSHQWVVCPFNTTHRCIKEELSEHLKECEDAAWLKGAGSCSDQRSTADVPKPVLVECDENWDEEPPVPSYNPSVYCEENNIMRTLKGHSKAVRRNFRESERRRLADKQ